MWEYPTHYNRYWLGLFKTFGVSAAKKSSTVVTVTSYAKDQIAKYSGIEAANIVPIHIGPKSSIAEAHTSASNIDTAQLNSATNNWEQLLQKNISYTLAPSKKEKTLLH
jgi:hypothetical protein